MWYDRVTAMLVMVISNASSSNAEDEEEITDQEVEAFLTSVICVTIFTIFIFTVFQRTRNGNTDDNNQLTYRNSQTMNNATLQHGQRQHVGIRQVEMEQQTQRRWDAGREEEDSNNIPMPPPDSKYKLLIDGILPYRHGNAKEWNLDTRQQNSKLDIISAIFGSIALSRGCNVVLTLKQADLMKDENNDGKSLESVCSALTTVGSEYNLFVILHLESEDTDVEMVSERLNSIPEGVLPKHRIIAATSIRGRVAFVRQLNPELVVDYDTEIQKQLTRFGFRVHIYGDGTGGFQKLCQLVI